MPGRTLNAQKRLVFDSVFGTPSVSQPTPSATPVTGFAAPGQIVGALPGSRGGARSLNRSTKSTTPSRSVVSDHVQDQVQWDRSWHIVTRVLELPDFPEHRGVLEALQPERGSVGQEFDAALNVLLHPTDYVPLARQTEDIVVWHTSQVRRHFIRQVLPIILGLKKHDSPDAVILRAVKVLETAQRQYIHGLSFIKEHIDNTGPSGASALMVAKFRREVHAIVSNSVSEPLSEVLTKVLVRHVSNILGLSTTANSHPIILESPDTERSRRELLGLVDSLRNVGMAGEQFQVIFAEVMNNAMTGYVNQGCRGVWTEENVSDVQASNSTSPRSSASRCVSDLGGWIEDRYAKLAVQVLSMLDNKVSISWTDKEKYKQMGIGRLAELRINELYDIVTNWPHNKGALEDLRTAISTPQRRLHLTEVFAQALSEKLLHPGTSTLLILQTYISMIWSFHALDHSKVLLDRVAYPLQLYLCSREDTVRIIITGLLSDTEDANGEPITSSPDKLVELARLLNSETEQIGPRADDEELDWHDMEWLPDPVDAGPGYKRSKNADIIGTLIEVLGSQEVFIKEFQNVMSENLLRHDGNFEKEIKVLELLKVRYGEAPLQACEVMLKDIQDSVKLTNMMKYTVEKAGVDSKETSFNAKILSRLFWPELSDKSYRVPDSILKIQENYGEAFLMAKSHTRKLTWLHALGQATVELELEDRIVEEEVFTWQAAVINAFHSSDSSPVEKSITSLVEELEMEESAVRSALKFWVNKVVLQEISPNTYSVLETLNQADRERSNAQGAPSHGANNNKDSSMDDDRSHGGSEGGMKNKMVIYWSFIQGMLKNSSKQMTTAQIKVMLNMYVVEGFPYSHEELGEFLQGKVQEGELDVVGGGKYKLVKK